MAEGLSRQEQLNQLMNAKRVVDELTKKLGIIPEDGGEENGDGNPDARLFDAMSPKEKYTLYVENRERWRELIAAKQEEGIRTLLRKR